MTIDIGFITKDELKKHIISTNPDFLIITDFSNTIKGWIIGAKRDKSVFDLKFEMKLSTFIEKIDLPNIKEDTTIFKQAKLQYQKRKEILIKNLESFFKDIQIENQEPPYLLIGRKCESAPIRSTRKLIKKSKRE